MSFISYNRKEDMQDDTYKFISGLIIDCVVCMRNKDVETFYTDLDALYCVTWGKMKQEEVEVFEERLSEVKESLYGDDFTAEDATNAYDELRGLFKVLTGILNRKGMLFSIEADLDNLVATSK